MIRVLWDSSYGVGVSALDTRSEWDIQLALSELMRRRTVVAIAHRLSTVSSFDRIVVLVEGKVVENGSPSILRKDGGIFNRLWAFQAEGFHEKEGNIKRIPQPKIYILLGYIAIARDIIPVRWDLSTQFLLNLQS